jgi:hypothetical protein
MPQLGRFCLKNKVPPAAEATGGGGQNAPVSNCAWP